MWLQIRLLFSTLAVASLVSSGCNPFQSSSSSTQKIKQDSCAAATALRLTQQEKSDTPSQDADAVRAGALAVGNTMVSDLCQELKTEHDNDLAAVIVDGAKVEMNAAVGSLIIVNDDGTLGLKRASPFVLTSARASIIAPLVVTAPIVRGAFLRLTHPQASLDAVATRVALAQDIISGTSAALNGKTSGMNTAETLDLMSGLANSAVKTLPEANLAGENSKESVAAVTLTAVGSLPKAGFESSNLGEAAQKLAEGAVSALNTPGFDQTSLGSLTGEVAGSAIQGLSAAGLSAEKIIETGAIESIISGATSGLKSNDTSADKAVEAIGSIAGAAVSVLSKVGLTSPEMQKNALAAVVKSSMSGAQSLAGETGATVADAMSAVASQAVIALTSGGFESSEIGNAISVIVETGVSELARSGDTNATAATAIASKLIEGALSGAGSLIQSGAINTDQASEVARAASSGAVEGLQSLQTAGIVTGDAVSVFTETIVESVSSGLEKAGADAQVIADAESGASTVVESPEVQEQIQASAGTAEAVSTPTFSVAAGSYSAAISVSISTNTAGASIRYTLDGSTPSASNGTIYGNALTITSTKTLKAIAYKTGWSNSEVAAATYTVSIAAFSSATPYTTGTNPEGVAAGDLNGDGKVDLAVALYTGRGVSFLLGQGNGTFAAKQDMSSSPNSAGTYNTIQSAMIAISDLSTDGKSDILWGAWGHNFVSVLTNTTTANASTLTFANNMPTGYNPGISGPRGVAVTDIDADGYKDIVVGEGNGNKLIVYLNQSGSPGAFTLFGSNWLFNPDSSVYVGNAHPWMVAVGDFNSDGKPDVVGGGGFAGIFSVMLNNTSAAGTPAFQTANRINTNTALGCVENKNLSVSDFNGDGKVDVVATCATSGTDKAVLFLNTTATNATAASFSTSTVDSTKGIKAVAAGDVNADGKMDLVTITADAADALHYFRGLGDGTFASPESFTIGTGTGPSKVILADVNADSRLDAIVTNGTTNQVTVFLNQLP